MAPNGSDGVAEFNQEIESLIKRFQRDYDWDDEMAAHMLATQIVPHGSQIKRRTNADRGTIVQNAAENIKRATTKKGSSRRSGRR